MLFLFYLCNISLISLMLIWDFSLLEFSFCFSFVACFIIFLLCCVSSNTQLSLAVLLFKNEALRNHLASVCERISLCAGGYNTRQWRKPLAFYLWIFQVQISTSFLWICLFSPRKEILISCFRDEVMIKKDKETAAVLEMSGGKKPGVLTIQDVPFLLATQFSVCHLLRLSALCVWGPQSRISSFG